MYIHRTVLKNTTLQYIVSQVTKTVPLRMNQYPDKTDKCYTNNNSH